MFTFHLYTGLSSEFSRQLSSGSAMSLQPMSTRLFQRILKPMATIVVALCCTQSSVSWMRFLNGLVFLPVLTTWESIVVAFCLVCAKTQNKKDFDLINKINWVRFEDSCCATFLLIYCIEKWSSTQTWNFISRIQYLELNLFFECNEWHIKNFVKYWKYCFEVKQEAKEKTWIY